MSLRTIVNKIMNVLADVDPEVLHNNTDVYILHYIRKFHKEFAVPLDPPMSWG